MKDRGKLTELDTSGVGREGKTERRKRKEEARSARIVRPAQPSLDPLKWRTRGRGDEMPEATHLIS